MGQLLSLGAWGMGTAASATSCIVDRLACCAISSIASCLCTACCNCMCGRSADGTIQPGLLTKAYYLFFMTISFLFALFMQYYVADHVDMAMWRINCDPHHPAEPSSSKWSLTGLSPVQTEFYIACKGSGAVYRVSFVTAVFFLVMVIGTRIDPRVHWTHWGQKSILYFFLLAISVFLPNNLFEDIGFTWISRIVSLLFLMVQIVMLIDFAYTWNESWVANADAEPFEGNKWLHGLLASCVTLYLGSLVGIGWLFAYYTACGLATFFVVMTFLGVVALTLVQLAGEEGALLPSAVVSAYSVYLCWAALVSNPHAECNPELSGSDGVSATDPAQATVHIMVGVGLAVFSLAWTTLSTADAAPELIRKVGTAASASVGQLNASEQQLKEVLVSSKMESGDADGDEDGDGGMGEGEQEPWVFHLIMFTGALYMAMLLTDWGTVSNSAAADASATSGSPVTSNAELQSQLLTGGSASMWVKIISQWLAVSLYIWTLVAPTMFPDYEFG